MSRRRQEERESHARLLRKQAIRQSGNEDVTWEGPGNGACS